MKTITKQEFLDTFEGDMDIHEALQLAAWGMFLCAGGQLVIKDEDAADQLELL